MLTDTSAAEPKTGVGSLNSTCAGSIFPALAVVQVGAVWIPATVMAILLLARVESWWIPSLVLSLGLLGAFAYFLLKPFPQKMILPGMAACFGALLLAAKACLYLYDTMHDSRGYHADAILALLHNINPLYQHIPEIRPLNANHFPKATWYFAAFVIHWVGHYQVGKIYNFILTFACFSYARYFFEQRKLSSESSFMLAAVTAVSAVAGSQMLTFYVDGALGALLVLSILAAVNLVYSPSRYDRWIFFLSASLSIAIKFTCLFYVAAIFFGLMAARFLLRRQCQQGIDFRRTIRGDALLIAGVYLCGVLVLGYDPYVTNVQRGFNPLYPVVSHDNADFIRNADTPPGLADRSDNRVGQFLISFFGASQTFDNKPVHLKVPFSVSKKELINMGAPDSVIAGWGVFFSGVTILGLILFVAGKGWQDNAALLFALGLVALTALINPLCWCARFTPQLAIVPVLLVATVLNKNEAKPVRLGIQVTCGFLILNSLIAASAGAGAACVRSRHLDHLLAAVRKTSGAGDYWAYRDPSSHEHYEQFSGDQGIRICGQIENPSEPPPSGGSPLTVNARNQTEVTLFRGSCAAPPPIPDSGQIDVR